MSVSYKNFEGDGNIDLSDGEYILDDDGFVCTSKGQEEKPIPSSKNDRELILDKLRFIQEGNPNIEAVFIEDSDEDDTTTASRNSQTSPKHTLARPRPAFSRSNGEGKSRVESDEAENNIISDEDTSSASETEYFHSSPITALAKTVTTPNVNQRVGNASVTQNSSPKPNVTSNKPTLPSPNHISCQKPPPRPLIVKEVSSSTLTSNFMKNTNRIVLDNPNGSGKQILVIPDEVLPLIASSSHPITLNVPGVGSVVINKSKSLMPRPQPVRKAPDPDPPTYYPLSDPKYQFWKFRRGIKRDLEGYSINDRLGFFKAEQTRSRMCMLYYENAIKKMESEIEVLSRKFGLLPKPVEIKEEKKTRKARKKSIKEVKGDNLTPIQKKNLHVIKRWKAHFKNKTELPSSDSSEDDENLFVTKKRLDREKKRKATKQKIERKSALNKKKTLTKTMKWHNAELSPLKNPYLKKYRTYENSCKIINKLEDLELEMNPDKPVLVINDENYLSTDFEKLRLKNNLVYPCASEISIPKILVNNAAMYNLWFVKPDILDKYLSKRNQ